jgi:oligoribonuclease NrnB/cAMP/cGMP phosphodiesterase (DHH superfamily)
MLANLTHYDLDGVVSHMILLPLFKETPRYYCCGYAKLDSNIDRMISEAKVFHLDNLIITDLSLSLEQVKRIKKYFQNIFYIDHHATSEINREELSKEINNLVVSTKRSAALLTFELFSEKLKQKLTPEDFNKLKVLAELASTYDNWLTDHPDFTKGYYLNALFWKLSWADFIKRFKNGYDHLTDEEQEVVVAIVKDKKKMLDEADKIVFPNDKKNAILIFHEDSEYIIQEATIIMKQYDHFFILNSTTNTVSIRTKKGKDLSIVLKSIEKHEGVKSCGGHAAAGGVTLLPNYTKEQFEDIVNTIYDFLEKKDE